MNVKFMDGDKVVIRRSGWLFGCRYLLGTVEAVTPSGQIRLTDKSRFLPSGYRIGEISEVILPATDTTGQSYKTQTLKEQHYDHNHNAQHCPRRTDRTAEDPGEV
jgi:hypothetical protein